MADLARSAVLVSSEPIHPNSLPADVKSDGGAPPVVEGPTGDDLNSAAAALRRYATTGFQASHFAQAVAICSNMLRPQVPSNVLPPSQSQSTAPAGELSGVQGSGDQPAVLVQPSIFLGVTANLFGTGCREAIRFLCKESVPLPSGVEPAVLPDPMLDPVRNNNHNDEDTVIPVPSFASKALIHTIVVSGGAMEHDIRRACESYEISLDHGNEEMMMTMMKKGQQQQQKSDEPNKKKFRFGNIFYSNGNNTTMIANNNNASPSLFDVVMRRLVLRLNTLQQRCKVSCAARPITTPYEDVCSWAISPSTVWYLAGKWMPELLLEALMEVNGTITTTTTKEEEEKKETEIAGNRGDEKSLTEEAQKRAESTVLYWAAKNDVPIFSPSFADGDIMQFILNAGGPLLQLDLVTDIHRINRFAMRSRRTGMIILGGGVVKHHVCNANLMRNGADSTVFINNAQEFDGSDAGARPDEAISWGKIRLDGEFVKVYSEVSLVFPLLLTEVFLPYVRDARGLSGTA
ncbi:deoxyhypusine synthase [Trypanosoma theileri]|uniref:Deoxyhypusine synthase n=1 Tax=Trypanosoma theileri TaxID=67003 RepID=A0A1X0P8R7_9TRYP|nr:deoxyhypusine synthase [Trypanosoma theileri]ORC93258.1 deoxyhypusine synthase [Trypanosoma theileri]